MIPAESVDVFTMSWQPEAADYAEAFRARNRKRHVGWLPWAMVVLGVVFAVLAVVGREPGLAVFGVVFAVFFALARAGAGLLFRRTPQLQQPVHVSIDARDGITGDLPVVTMAPGAMKVRARARLAWADLRSVLETERVFVVHLAGPDDKTFFLLAKRGLAAPGHEAALRRLLAG